ncbi:MAG TPA: serine hydrolase domain-containing protein [Dermatophilaceae bacterium]|nr:serine hydrolase domain-containing protein [Dermatophilaceae bacterium]
MPVTSSAVLDGRWPPPVSGRLPDATAARLQREVQRWVDATFFSGVTAAVVTPEGTWAGAAGVDGAGTRLEPGSGMALASISKTFTAAEVMLLAERGELDLDAPAARFVRVPQVSNGVTVRQLLAHRSGVPQAPDPVGAKVMSTPDEHWSPQRVLASVPAPLDQPGAEFDYNNVNYLLLGLIAEKAARVDLATALRRDLWDPQGLDRLAMQDAQRLAPPLARPAADEIPRPPKNQQYLPFRSFVSALAAAGGVAGDAQTVARWGYLLYGAQLLRPETVAQMTDFGDGDGYGLGTADFTHGVAYRSNIDGYGHEGDVPGYRTVLAVIPSRRISVAILTPSASPTIGYVQYLLEAGGLTGG